MKHVARNTQKKMSATTPEPNRHHTELLPVIYFQLTESEQQVLKTRFSEALTTEYRRFITEPLPEDQFQQDLQTFHSVIYVSVTFPKYLEQNSRMKFYKLDLPDVADDEKHALRERRIERMLGDLLQDLALFYTEIVECLPSNAASQDLKRMFFTRISNSYGHIAKGLERLKNIGDE